MLGKVSKFACLSIGESKFQAKLAVKNQLCKPKNHAMSQHSFFRKAVSMYVDGFRDMTVGKRLWALILIKLALLFLVFRLFFFPDLLEENYDNDTDRAQAVRTALTGH